MRFRREKERKPLARPDAATGHVEALGRNMTRARTKNEPDATTAGVVQGQKNGSVAANDAQQEQPGRSDERPSPNPRAPRAEDETLTIKRTYVFAGETISEEKQVPKASAEARLYLKSLREPDANASAAASPTKPPLRRPKKRTSMFEPNPHGTVKGLTPTGASANKGPKLNTIEKSKLDWAGFVDKEGIQEELDGAGKAKEGYLGRMDFLGRVEAKREEEAKSARKK